MYVGKTKNKISERFNGHWADFKNGDESKPAFHFKKDGHEEEDMEVIGLEHVPGDDDVFRIARERWWMTRMGTLEEENRKRWLWIALGFFSMTIDTNPGAEGGTDVQKKDLQKNGG